MATITELTETFENGSNGATLTTSNTIFFNFPGTLTPTFTSDAAVGSLAMDITTSSNTNLARSVFTSASTVWVSYFLKIVTLPGVSTIISAWYDSTNSNVKIGDLRLNSDATITLRDASTAQWTSTALATNAWHRIAFKTVPNSATGHQLKIYSDSNLFGTTASQDSGNATATAAGVSTVDNMRFGSIVAETTEIIIDHLQGDNASEPTPPAAPTGAILFPWISA